MIINIFYYFLRKFCLPSILTSDNNSTWLATRKNDNDLAKSAANKSNQNQSGSIKINQDQTGSIKINQDDNAKWLLKPLNKSETDLVTLTGRLTKIIFWFFFCFLRLPIRMYCTCWKLHNKFVYKVYQFLTLWLRLNYYAPKMRGHRKQWISNKMNIRHPGQLKWKSWGPFWSYQLNSTANPAHLPQNWAKLAVLFSW